MTYLPEKVRTYGMDLVITSDSLPIPITLAEVKETLAIDFVDNDAYLTRLLEGAFKEVELFIQKGLKTKTIVQSYKSINGTIELVFSPVQSITSVKNFKNEDLTYTTSHNNTKISAYSDSGIIITFVGGYTTLPTDIKNAIIDIVAVDFDNEVADKAKAIADVKNRLRHYRPKYV